MSSSILKINIFDAFMKVNHTQCNVRNALMNGDKVKCAYITSASLNSLQSCSSSRKRKNLINSSTHIFGVSLQVEVFIYNTLAPSCQLGLAQLTKLTDLYNSSRTPSPWVFSKGKHIPFLLKGRHPLTKNKKKIHR